MALRGREKAKRSASAVRSPVRLSFGSVPVTVDPAAAQLLGALPQPALSSVLAAVRSWTESGGVKRIRTFTFQDPENTDAEEAVLEIGVEGDTPGALARWRTLAAAVDQAKAGMSDEERRILDKRLGLQLAWGEDA